MLEKSLPREQFFDIFLGFVDPSTPAKLQNHFERMDINNDGFVDLTEMW